MKKRTLLSMLLMLAMMLSLVGCGSDDKKPTSTDTAVNGTEATTDVAEKPTEVETPTPEPEKNVITLLSPDEKTIITEMDIPEGYTVVSDKKGNHIELTKDDNKYVKVEIYSGLNADALSAWFVPYDREIDNPAVYRTEEDRTEAINEMSESLGIDVKYFNQPLLPNSYSLANNKLSIYSEKLGLTKKPDGRLKEYKIDITNHNDTETYPVSVESYMISSYGEYVPVEKTYTIKVTSFFNEKWFDEKHPSSKKDTLIEKLYTYADNAGRRYKDFNAFLEAFQKANQHRNK